MQTAWLVIVIGRLWVATVPMASEAECYDALRQFLREVPTDRAQAACVIHGPRQPDNWLTPRQARNDV
jgi:hypothetical protein